MARSKEIQVAVTDDPPRQTTLQIVDELVELSDLLADATEEEIVFIEERLRQVISVDLVKKIDGIGVYNRQVEKATVPFFKSEKERLSRKIKAAEKSLDSIYDLVRYAMVKLDVTYMAGRYTKIRLNPGKPSLDVYNEAEVPACYFDEVKVRVRNDNRIREDLKANIPVPGARMKTGDDYLTIT